MTNRRPVILSIHSQVVYGSVGNSIVAPILQAMGVEVWQVPTVMLSNHPGYGRSEGRVAAEGEIHAAIDAIHAHGWLGDVDGMLVGYLGSPDQVEAVLRTVRRVKAANPEVVVCCDPVIGDEPKGIYVKPEVAAAIRSRLVPIADVITPNAFELQWLTGEPILGPTEAVRAARSVSNGLVLATSVPFGDGGIGTGLIGPEEAWWATTLARTAVPNGTGDAMAAILLGQFLLGWTGGEALGRTVGVLEALIEASAGLNRLTVAGEMHRFAEARVWPVERMA